MLHPHVAAVARAEPVAPPALRRVVAAVHRHKVAAAEASRISVWSRMKTLPQPLTHRLLRSLAERMRVLQPATRLP